MNGMIKETRWARVAAGLVLTAVDAAAQPWELLARAEAEAARMSEMWLLDAGAGAAQRDREAEQKEREAERAAERAAAMRQREADLYEAGQDALQESQWQRALERSNSLVAMKGSRADAALYWKAYTLDKLGQKAEALAAAAELTKGYPASKWLSDAKALEVQVRQSVGQPVRPEDASDEEIKLLALQALQHSDPEQAIPMLEKILTGPQSPRLKSRALFVLAQSNSPRARQVLANIAKGGSNPDLQSRAIQYLGTRRSTENSQLLAEIYGSTTDVEVKRRILRSFAVSQDRARVFAAATSESAPELRSEAVRQLGVMRAHDELNQLYQKETTVEIKRQILQAMFIGNNAARLIELANSEPNAELRRYAIRNLGLIRSQASADALVALYAREKDVEIRKAIISGLFTQNNATQLVAIARKETDPVMRRELVSRLSTMRSKVATDYMLEILNK